MIFGLYQLNRLLGIWRYQLGSMSEGTPLVTGRSRTGSSLAGCVWCRSGMTASCAWRSLAGE